MAESSNPTQIPSPPDVTPMEEPVILNRPKSPNPFLPADQVEFNFDQITFTTNNKVVLLYPEHPNSEYFQIVSNFISKCCLKEAFTRAPNQYKYYLSEFWFTAKTLEDSKIWVSTPIDRIRGDICITTFKNALRAHYLPYSSGKTGGHDQISNKDVIILYCLANGVQGDYAKLIWEDIIHKLHKKTREKALKPNQPEGPLFTAHMLAIYYTDVPMAPKAPKTSLHSEKKVLQGRKPRAKSGLKRKQFSKHTSKSQTEASKSKAGHLENENLSKAGGPTSLGATSEEGAHPQLSSYSIAEADLGKSAPNDSIPHQQDQTKSVGDGLKIGHTDLGTNKESRSDDISRKIKLEDLSDLMKDTRYAFFTPDSLNDEPIIVTDESEEDEAEKHKEAHDASHNEPEDTLASHPPSPKLVQLQELKDQLSNLLASHDFASSIPSELKELPSEITTLSGEIQEQERHVAELKTLKWELSAEFLALPSQILSVQAKLHTLDTLPSLLNKVADTLTRFPNIMKNASYTAKSKGIPLVGPATDSPAEVGKNTNPAIMDA
ncbi:hypothetical protein Tco_0900878 [Tanacetum coccineum]